MYTKFPSWTNADCCHVYKSYWLNFVTISQWYCVGYRHWKCSESCNVAGMMPVWLSRDHFHCLLLPRTHHTEKKTGARQIFRWRAAAAPLLRCPVWLLYYQGHQNRGSTVTILRCFCRTLHLLHVATCSYSTLVVNDKEKSWQCQTHMMEAVYLANFRKSVCIFMKKVSIQNHCESDVRLQGWGEMFVLTSQRSSSLLLVVRTYYLKEFLLFGAHFLL